MREARSEQDRHFLLWADDWNYPRRHNGSRIGALFGPMNAEQLSIDAAREDEIQRVEVNRDRAAEFQAPWSLHQSLYFAAENRSVLCLEMLKFRRNVRRCWG